MFARFTRFPLRRCIHTTSASSHHWSRTAKLALGASAATAMYMTWRLTNGKRTRDNVNSTKVIENPSNSLLPPESSASHPSTSEPPQPSGAPAEPDFIPDSEQPGAPTEKDDSTEEPSDGMPESSTTGAFNPQTGEINWDCPCLGGMAHGPCGPEFREAFSCFVFSEVEPKGIDCVEKFKAMQTCFRDHPEVYADEIMDDDDDDEAPDLPPATDSSEKVAADSSPETTSEKQPQLQKVRTEDS